MSELKPGDVIAVKDEHAEFIAERFKALDNLQHSIQVQLVIAGQESERVWERIFELYPELRGRDGHWDAKNKCFIVFDTWQSRKNRA